MGNFLESSELKTGTSDIPEVNEGIRESEASDSVSEVPNDNNDFIESLQQDLENYEDSVETINVREYGLMECTEATKEIFTPEVVNDWGDYSREQKAEIVNEYSKAIVEGLNINFEGAVFEEMDEYTYGYTCGDGYIHLNENMLDGYLPYSLIDTVAHELRHQLQCEAMENPEKFGIDEGTIETWQYGEDTYWLGLFDPENYYRYNPLELDARYFGESMVNELIKEIHNEI